MADVQRSHVWHYNLYKGYISWLVAVAVVDIDAGTSSHIVVIDALCTL